VDRPGNIGTGGPVRRRVGALRILIASTPVGALGTGVGGGVELTLHGLVHGLGALGHRVDVVAPAGSVHVGAVVHQVAGTLQASSQLSDRSAPTELPAGSVLVAMWDRIVEMCDDVDIVVNLAYDWLPMYLTRFIEVPVVHLVSMGSLTDAMDGAIADVAARHPGRLAAHTRSQAATFDDPSWFRLLASGIVTDRYDVRLSPDVPAYLGAVGRISPEKGLEDVAEVSARTGWPVRVWGVMQDRAYWDHLRNQHPTARLEYCGFLPTDELQAAVGGCSAVLMTPKWVEAFGNVAIEAMATGVPVIAYDRGGPAEIVTDGDTGFVVPADDVDALIGAIARIDSIQRIRCRQRVEEHFSAKAFAGRVETWLQEVVATSRADRRRR
jgi:UDP-glucose:tetrahydrobiopterin glucosyltransferase